MTEPKTKEPQGDAPPADRPEVSTNGHPPDSVLANLRERRKKISEVKEHTMEIPGYGGELHCRYRKLEFDDINKISEKARTSQNPAKALLGQCDFLVQACDTLMIRGTDGSLKPMQELYPELGDEPIRFDERLGQALGYEATSARKAVLGVFNNDLALNDQANDLMLWMRSSDREVEEDFTAS